jgi:hypothetical protein
VGLAGLAYGAFPFVVFAFVFVEWVLLQKRRHDFLCPSIHEILHEFPKGTWPLTRNTPDLNPSLSSW